MNEYQDVYEDLFNQNLKRYSGLREPITRKIKRIIKNPYVGTELLRNVTGKLDLQGFRSARVGNFRLIFVICGEYWKVKKSQFSACEGKKDETIIFLTVGPHDAAYAMK